MLIFRWFGIAVRSLTTYPFSLLRFADKTALTFSDISSRYHWSMSPLICRAFRFCRLEVSALSIILKSECSTPETYSLGNALQVPDHGKIVIVFYIAKHQTYVTVHPQSFCWIPVVVGRILKIIVIIYVVYYPSLFSQRDFNNIIWLFMLSLLSSGWSLFLSSCDSRTYSAALICSIIKCS